MDPIERKPLPPPNANVTTLTEDDRAEFLARANEVINHYLAAPDPIGMKDHESRSRKLSAICAPFIRK